MYVFRLTEIYWLNHTLACLSITADTGTIHLHLYYWTCFNREQYLIVYVCPILEQHVKWFIFFAFTSIYIVQPGMRYEGDRLLQTFHLALQLPLCNRKKTEHLNVIACQSFNNLKTMWRYVCAIYVQLIVQSKKTPELANIERSFSHALKN